VLARNPLKNKALAKAVAHDLAVELGTANVTVHEITDSPLGEWN
jgi:hypothetical protein